MPDAPTNGGAVSIAYDGDGNRAAKTVIGVATQYLVDDANPTGYAQVMDEVVNGAVRRTYTYGLQRIDEVIDRSCQSCSDFQRGH